MPDEEVGNRKDDAEAPGPDAVTDEMPPTEAAPETGPAGAPEPEPEPEAAEPAPEEGGDRLRGALDRAVARADAAERTAAQQLDRLRRLQAEFENYRKRVRRDQEEERKRANERLLGELLPVLDSFERALTDPGDRDSLLDGLKLIQKQLTHALTLQGLERVESVGQPFDPVRHEALAREPSEDHPEDTVLREFEAGYTLHGRVLRPARVVVAAAPPVAGTEEAPIERKTQEPEATKPTGETGVAEEGDQTGE